MSIEEHFDLPLIAAMALREKQIQQNYRPIIAVHKWFARRPGTLFRGLTLSEFSERPLSESFFQANDFPGRLVLDPFMGGGTPLLEANRVGCDVQGFDINPMAAWIVREEIEHLNIAAYRSASATLIDELTRDLGTSYQTDCVLFGDKNVPVKYFLWVKTLRCEACRVTIDLFPGYLVADDTRHPRHVLVCANCGELNEVADPKHDNRCAQCSIMLQVFGPARRNKCRCPNCGRINTYPRPAEGPPQHRMFAIEYYNPQRRHQHKGRFFKRPDANDLARHAIVVDRWRTTAHSFAPEREILAGDETDRLHRWGYRRYCEMFNERQLVGLELSCHLISRVADDRIRHALATNLSDLLRYQNMLCRYDPMALKSLDIFSVHGFPVGLVQCESNLIGIKNASGANVGSGGWWNIVGKYANAKQYCFSPFEVRPGAKTVVPIEGEWIGERLNGGRQRSVSIRCGSATRLQLEAGSVDAAFTDPPYFGNVQYGELMDFCYVWLRQLASRDAEGFNRETTRSPDELTGNITESRDLAHFTKGLSDSYQAVAYGLKRGAPLAFTFHHNRIEAYHAVGVALLDAGLTCSASIPCPAEMGGSIHIHGTGSSIIDTIFVCRSTGATKQSLLFDDEDQLQRILRNDISLLRAAGVKPTVGDIRCTAFGHLTRMAIWRLRGNWDRNRRVDTRLRLFADEMTRIAPPSDIVRRFTGEFPSHRFEMAEDTQEFEADLADAVPF